MRACNEKLMDHFDYFQGERLNVSRFAPIGELDVQVGKKCQTVVHYSDMPDCTELL